MMNKILAYFFSLISLLIAIYLIMDLQGIGFPDGHITEYEFVLAKVYPPYIVIFLLFSSYFLYLGFTGGKNKTYAKPRLALLLFGILLLLFFAIMYYVGLNFEHGTGG